MSTIPANDRLATRFMREWLFLAAALLMLGGGIGWNLYVDRQEIEDEEREKLSRRARMIDENIGRQLFATNRALESIRRDLPGLKMNEGNTDRISERLQALSEVMPGVRTLLIYDADATVVAANRKELIGSNFRERDYLQAARQSRNPALLHLSAPYTTVLGAFAMTAVRVIADDRGQMLGMVGVTIDPGYFKTLLHSVTYAPDMRVSITHSDGRLFAIAPEQAGGQEQNLAQPGSFFSRHRDSGQQETVITGIAHATGDARMIAMRTIKPADVLMDKTLVVSVARDLTAIFAVWRKDAYEKAALFGLVTLIAAGGLFLSQRRQRAYARVVSGGRNERRLASEALRRTQDLLARAEQLGKLGGWEFDIETGQQTWTQAVYDIHELDITALPTVSQGISFYTPESRPVIEQAVQRAIEQGEPFDVELEIITAKGNRRDVHAIGEADAARHKVAGFIQDITERNRAESALRESRELLVYAFDKSPLMNSLSDLATGKYLEVNDSFCRVSKFSREEVIGKTAIELGWISKDERLRIIQEVQKTGWVNGMELALRTKNGQDIIGRYWGTVIHGAQGDKLFSAAEDVTERKQADQLFRESENRYRALVSNLSAGVVVHNADTSVLLANPAAISLLGLSEEQILGKTAIDPYWCFLHEDGALMPLKDYPVNQAMASRAGVHNWVVGVRRPDRAEPLWLLCNASQIRDEKDNPVQVVVTFIDITERKQAEARIRESEQRLDSEHVAALEAQRQAGLAALNLMEDAVAARNRAEAALADLARLGRIYATHSQCNQLIVRCNSEDALFPQVCRDTVNLAGFKMAWIGQVDTGDGLVKPVAAFGDDAGYLTDLVITMDPGDPRGQGPTAIAIRENQPVWCQDFLHDSRTAPWREAGARAGWAASAALPLCRNGVALGALTLYAGEAEFFDDEIKTLLVNMAADIGFAMDSYASVAERRRAESRMAGQIDELQRWQQVTIGREGRILAMKQEVNSLLAELGRPPRYSSAADAEAER